MSPFEVNRSDRKRESSGDLSEGTSTDTGTRKFQPKFCNVFSHWFPFKYSHNFASIRCSAWIIYSSKSIRLNSNESQCKFEQIHTICDKLNKFFGSPISTRIASLGHENHEIEQQQMENILIYYVLVLGVVYRAEFENRFFLAHLQLVFEFRMVLNGDNRSRGIDWH